MINSNLPSFAIEQHYEARDLAIKRLVDLHNDDFDISDKKLFFGILESYGLLSDGFALDDDIDYIVKEVNKHIA